MKTKMTFATLLIFGVLISECIEKASAQEAKIDLLNDQFPEAQQEIMETFGAIAHSLKDGDMDKLISFHAYGPKFTEFKKENHVMEAKLMKHLNALFLAVSQK
ncbi:hypothetical protein [Ulvibacterium marinum]|uniref:hypothetical protein n=1 Tax=Ulvibacterium marinum TaxID=2419782 RepID=UPI001FE6B860|nr:hypothetical protein [Ulvibacterium marinum]